MDPDPVSFDCDEVQKEGSIVTRQQRSCKGAQQQQVTLADYTTRKQASADQVVALFEYLQEYPELARGRYRGKVDVHTLWNECAAKLNTLKDGAVKDGRQWAKFWADWKYRLRKKAVEIKAVTDKHLPLPEGLVPFSTMEESLLKLIADKSLDEMVIKTDPLAEEELDSEEANTIDNNGEVINLYYVDHDESPKTKKKIKSRKRRHSVKQNYAEEDSAEDQGLEDGGGPSSSPERKSTRRKLEQNLHVNGNNDQASDKDEEAAEFLRLEKRRLENSIQMTQTLENIATQITRIADTMTNIRDMFVNNRFNLNI